MLFIVNLARAIGLKVAAAALAAGRRLAARQVRGPE